MRCTLGAHICIVTKRSFNVRKNLHTFHIQVPRLSSAYLKDITISLFYLYCTARNAIQSQKFWHFGVEFICTFFQRRLATFSILICIPTSWFRDLHSRPDYVSSLTFLHKDLEVMRCNCNNNEFILTVSVSVRLTSQQIPD